MISVVVPCYEMHGRGVEMLRELLASIQAQEFADYEVIVSDSDGITRAMGATFKPEDIYRLGAKFVKGKQGAAANLNNAIDHAKGDIVKPMFQDDKFMYPDSLQKIADVFEGKLLAKEVTENHAYAVTRPGASWIACTSYNSGIENWEHVPRPHVTLARLREGENTYGSPTAMAWRRNDLRFDEKLAWLFDCEFYSRMAERYGVPTFVDTPIFIRQWEGQATRTICDGNQRIQDTNEVIEKYRDRNGAVRV